jgi:hypothetical protein
VSSGWTAFGRREREFSLITERNDTIDGVARRDRGV